MLGNIKLPTMSWCQPGYCFISRIFCHYFFSNLSIYCYYIYTSCFTKYHSIVNPRSSIFEMLNLKICDWLYLQCALRDINWGALFSLVLNEDYFYVFMREITKVCT